MRTTIMRWLKGLNGLYKTEFVSAIGFLDDDIVGEWETCKWVD